MTRYRCPECQAIVWSPRSMCAGGNQVYDPQAPPGARQPEHDPRLPVPEGVDTHDREPFDPTGMPYMVRARGNGTLPLWFGPFPSYSEAQRFADDHGMFAYSIDTVFPPSDVVGLRR